MPILNLSDFSNVQNRIEHLFGNEITECRFDASSSPRLLTHVNSLQNVTFQKCVFSNLNWMRKTIRNIVIFEGCLFTGGETSFENAVFEQDVSFNNCVFEGTVSFDNTIFQQNASFQYIHTLGQANSAFLFRGDEITHVCHPRYDSCYTFSNSIFENQVVFNYRQFDKLTLFENVQFKNYFFFADANLGHKTFFSNVKFPCIEETANINFLIRCFENLQHCLEMRGETLFKKTIQSIIKVLNKKNSVDDTLIEDEYVSRQVVLSRTNWSSNTLSCYCKRYPSYFEKIGNGKNTKFKWSGIQKYINDPSKERQKHKSPVSPKKSGGKNAK